MLSHYQDNPTPYHVALISVMTLSILWGSLNSYFVASDFYMIPLSVYDGWDNYIRLFLGDNINRAQGLGGYYRPIYNLSFTIDYALWGLNPFGYHLTNLIIHLSASILVYGVAYYLIQSQFVALLAGLLFSLHPLHTEATVYISGRVSSLVTVFYLLSLLLYLRAQERSSHAIYILSALTFIAALGSKETAATLPMVIFLYHFFLNSSRETKLARIIQALKQSAPFFLVLFVYLGFRYVILGRVAGIHTDNVIENTPLQLDLFKDLVHFFQFTFHLLIPIELGSKLTFFLSQKKILYFFIATTWFLLVAFIFLRLFYRSNTLTFLFLWLLVALFPVHQFSLSHFNLWGSRFLYLPSVPFCILLAILLRQVYAMSSTGNPSPVSRKWLSTALILLVLLAYASLFFHKTERMNQASLMVNSIIEETLNYLPAKINNGNIYFIGLPNTLHGALVFGSIEEAFHFFRKLYPDVQIHRLLMVNSRGNSDPDIKISFLDQTTLLLDITHCNLWEFLASPWPLAVSGGRIRHDIATITNKNIDKKNRSATLKIELEEPVPKQKTSHFFVYSKGHMYPAQAEIITKQ